MGAAQALQRTGEVLGVRLGLLALKVGRRSVGLIWPWLWLAVAEGPTCDGGGDDAPPGADGTATTAAVTTAAATGREAAAYVGGG